jgi:hypothetical protein
MLDKLKAVNNILDGIGEQPVNSLSSGLGDADTAARILDEVVEDVLDQGWNFNTEYEWEVTPDVNGFLVLPAGTLRADPDGNDKGRRLSVRVVDGQKRLYNVVDQTFVFTDPVTVTLVLTFAFDDLPHAFKRYCALKAAGVFQQSELGSQVLDGFLEKKIKEAWERLEDADAESEQANVLTDSASVYLTTYRNNRLYGVG